MTPKPLIVAGFLILLPLAPPAAARAEVLSSTARSAAQPSAPEEAVSGADLYAVVKAGGYSPRHSDLDGFATGFDGEVAIGDRFTPNLAVEAAIGWLRTRADGVVDGALSIVPLTATARLIAPAERLDLYALAGAGAYFASYEETSEYGSGRASATALGLHVGGGAALRVTPAASVGTEVRYLFARGSFSGADGAVDAHLNGLRVAATLEYRF